MWVQAIINGLLMGGVYALVAIGMTLVFGVTRIVNFSQGAMVAGGMYAAYTLSTVLRLDPYLTLVMIIPGFFVIGVLLFVAVIDPLMTRPPLMQLTFTLGLMITLEALFEIVWQNRPVRVRVMPFANLYFGSVYIPSTRLVAFAGAIVLALLLWQFLRRAPLGRAVRAAAEHPAMAQLVGIPRRRTLAIAFGIAVTTAGVAGALVAPFVTLSPYIGQGFLAAAFAAIVLGTKGNIQGALVAGLIIGLTESIGSQLFGDALKEAVFFAIVLAVLLIRPEGLWGQAS